MSQTNILSREQAVRIGEETSFGVTPSGSFPNAMTRIITAEPVMADGAVREMLDVNDIRVRRLDGVQPVQGLEIGSKLTLSQLLKATPSASQLIAAATPGALTPRLLLRHALGTEYAEAGSLVATGTSGTSIDVTSTEGALFRRATWIAVEVAGQMEPAFVTAISGDTLTIAPALSGTPSTGAIVRNLYNYAPAESHTNSLTVQVAYVGSTSAQYTFNGCHGSIKWNFGEFGKLVTQTLDMGSVSYTGPTAQSQTTSTATDEMGSGFPLQPSVYLSSTPLARATKLVCEKFSVEYTNTWEMVRDPSATQTVNSVVNTAGRPRPAKVMLTLRFDSDYGTSFDSETAYNMLIAQKIGTGTTASFWLWDLPNVKLVGQPKLTNVGSRLHMDLEFNVLQDDALAPAGGESASQLDALYAPLRVAFG